MNNLMKGSMIRVEEKQNMNSARCSEKKKCRVLIVLNAWSNKEWLLRNSKIYPYRFFCYTHFNSLHWQISSITNSLFSWIQNQFAELLIFFLILSLYSV